jgi:hypothetical protein
MSLLNAAPLIVALNVVLCLMTKNLGGEGGDMNCLFKAKLPITA